MGNPSNKGMDPLVGAARRPRVMPGVRPTCSECEEGAEQAAKVVRAQQNPAARSLETVAISGFDWAVLLLVGSAVVLTLPVMQERTSMEPHELGMSAV